MFDVASPELLVVAVVAIVVIGPKDLPKAMRVAGYWVGKARGTMRQFRAGFDAMVREAELEEMEKKWAEENKRIMAAVSPEEPAEQARVPAVSLVEGSGGDVAPAPVATRPAAPAGIASDPVEVPPTEDPPPVMTARPVIHDQPELPLAPAPEGRAT